MVGTKSGKVRKSMGNGEAEELTCMIHGHELREQRNKKKKSRTDQGPNVGED